MPAINETSLRPEGDAPDNMSTRLRFDPVNGPFDETTVVNGSIDDGDKDWIVIELSEGKEYTIKVSTRHTNDDGDEGGLNDTVLRLLDGKGVEIDMNDDIRPAGTTDEGTGKTDLSSRIKFTPEAGSGTQKYFLEVSAYTGNPFADNTGGYRVSVTEKAVLPVGDGADIVGTGNADKLAGTEGSESIMGLAGDDTLVGAGGDDTLHGGAGNDLLIGGKGADTLRGGKDTYNDDDVGGDTISYEGSAEGVTINLRDGTAMGGDAQGDTIGSDIENVIGSAYDDMITGTDSVQYGNSLWGLAGMDRLYGGEGADMLYGGAGDDILNGGDEDDTLEGGAGADELTGGLGDDTASYTSSAAGVVVRLHSGQAMGGDAEGDTWGDMVTVTYEVDAEDPEDPKVEMSETVPDIIHLMGSGMNDVLAGDSRNNDIWGGGGDDRIFGGPGGGNDKLYGGDGNDRLYGGRGNDELDGGDGNDHLWGNGGTDILEGGPGNDWYYLVAGATGSSTAGRTLDTVTEDTSMQRGMTVQNGTDWISFANSRSGIRDDGDTNTDAAGGYFIPANVENIIGSPENDTITGNGLMNIIEGGDGGDTLSGGAAGTGDPGDTLSYASSDRRVRVDLNADSASGGDASGDTIVADTFENVMGSAHGDTIMGDAGANTLWGLGGDDTIEGGAGNDTIEGGAGADELHGGHHDGTTAANTLTNTLSYAMSDAAVTVNLATATASGGHAEGDDIETYTYLDNRGTDDASDDVRVDIATFVNLTGSDHNDRLTGDRFDNTLNGGKGDDSLRGGDGADRLVGGAGADNLDGGKSPGEPRIDDGWNVHTTDWAVYRGATSGVTVRMTAEGAGMGTRGDAMGDSLKGVEVVWGSLDHDDVFIAGPGPDIFHGDGHNTRPGGRGDTVSFEASKHAVNVDLATHNSNAGYNDGRNDAGALDSTEVVTSWTIPTGDGLTYDHDGDALNADATANLPGIAAATDFSEKGYQVGDLYGGIENLTGSSLGDTLAGDGSDNVLQGGAGNDTLMGAAGNDTIHGDGGDDTIHGDGGNDMLKGMAGNDTIRGLAGNDTIEGGAGDDDLHGGEGVDTFVFAPGNGSDVILAGGFNAASTGGDRIDLSAFDIDPDDLADLITDRTGSAVINLEDYGGGRITITGVTKATLGTAQVSEPDPATPADLTDDTGIFIL